MASASVEMGDSGDASFAAHALAGMHKSKNSSEAAGTARHSTATSSSSSSGSSAATLGAYLGMSGQGNPHGLNAGSVPASSLLPPQWMFHQHQQQQQQQQQAFAHQAGMAAAYGVHHPGFAPGGVGFAAVPHTAGFRVSGGPAMLNQAATTPASSGAAYAPAYSVMQGHFVGGAPQYRSHPLSPAQPPLYATLHADSSFPVHQSGRAPPPAASAPAPSGRAKPAPAPSPAAPRAARGASRDTEPTGRRATAVAARQLIASSLESDSVASATLSPSAPPSSASAAAAALGSSSEILSLLDSRTVDVRVRGIVALAEQEAASRLQAAHPDTDEEDSASARKRKGSTDRASRRRELNRVNAKKSRLRKKFFIEALILRVAELEKVNERLREQAAGQDKGGAAAGGSDSTATTLTAGAAGGHASRCSGGSSGDARPRGGGSGHSDTRSNSRESSAAESAPQRQGTTGADAGGGTAAAEMPPPPTGSDLSATGAPRVLAASALTPQTRDALVAAGPDWDLVRWMDSSNQAFCIADPSTPDMPLAYVSPGFEVLTGYPAGEVIGRNCRFLQGPGTDPAARARMAAALRAGSGCVEVLLNYRKDGAPFWNRVLIAPLRDSTGAVRSYVSVQSCVSKALPALSGLARPQANAIAAPAPPPSQQPAKPILIANGHPSSFSAVHPPSVRPPVVGGQAAGPATGAESAALPRAPAPSPAAPAVTVAEAPSSPVSRAAACGAALSDADAALLISQISHTDSPAAAAVKREREHGPSSATVPATGRPRQ